MSQDLVGPILDTTTDDVIDPQILPPGQWRFIIKGVRWSEERRVYNFSLQCIDASVPGIDMSKPVGLVDWALWLPNRAKQDPATFENHRGVLKRHKAVFGIPDGETLNREATHFIGRQVDAIIVEQEQTPDKIAQYGRRMNVDRIVKAY
jgi:hypothetical protein